MEDLSRYYTLLRDPRRRRIIEILGEQGKIGFKELRQTLGLGVGTIYYHLDMLSDFLTQDKQHKYTLNERGKTLYRILKDGTVPTETALDAAFSYRFSRWVFLSPILSRAAESGKVFPVSFAILVLGAFGSAFAQLDSALFFYFPYSTYAFTTISALYVSNWIGLFLFSEILTYVLYRRVGNDLQTLMCICVATFPMALFPYVYVLTPSMIAQYVLFVLQIWNLLLVSAALSFGKGLRLDKAFLVSLAAMYVNVMILFLSGRFA